MTSLILVVLVAAMGWGGQAVSRAPADNRATEAEVRAFQAELFTAMQQRDRATLERLIADGFVFVHSTGGLENKQEFIDLAVAGAQTSQTANPEYVESPLRLHEHTAVRVTRSVRNKGGPAEMNMRTLHTYAKVAGRWQWVSGQSTQLPTRPTPAAIDLRVYDEYAGHYVTADNTTFTVTRTGDGLRGRLAGRPDLELIPRSDTEFTWFNPESTLDTRIVFERSNGAVTHAVLRRAGRDVWRATRQK